jgi:beta-galactosidase
VHRGDAGGWVESVRRGDLTFVINHGTAPVDLDLPGTDLLSGSAAAGLPLPAQGVAVVAEA